MRPDVVADILRACGALDPGSSPGRDANTKIGETNHEMARKIKTQAKRWQRYKKSRKTEV